MKKFVKNLSNRQPTKDITLDDRKNKLKLSTAKKKIQIKIDNNTVFGGKTIPIIAGPNGVESLELMRNVAKVLKKQYKPNSWSCLQTFNFSVSL